MAALSVSGCAGTNTGGSATPTVAPGGATATPTPGGSLKTGSLFDFDKLKSYEWKITSTVDDKTNVTYFKFEKATTTYNGTAALEEKMTVTAEGTDVMIMDIFYSPVDHKQLGGKFKLGDFEMDIPASGDSQYSSMFDAYNVADTYRSSDWPLANRGVETLTINGRTYVCDKYWVGSSGEQGTVWLSSGVPMPVKIESRSPTGSWKYELWSWG